MRRGNQFLLPDENAIAVAEHLAERYGLPKWQFTLSPRLRAFIRFFMANRGVRESGWWLGPTVSVARSAEDVDRYVDVFDEFLTAVAGS